MCYGLQHFLSMAGSLIFIPLIMVPAMGGTDVSVVLSMTLVCRAIFIVLFITIMNDDRKILPQ